MRKSVWISAALCTVMICAAAGAAGVVHMEVPKQLQGKPLLAEVPEQSGPKSLKDVIYETQKLVVTIETPDGMQGSGFLYNDQGDLITNAHVVTGATDVTVKTADARVLQGKVIGISEETDVAVVRVQELAGVQPLPVIRDRKAEVGDEVIAVGSPLGFQNTVTTGIISGVGRSFVIDPYSYKDLYQISAVIAKGNSGGPLVDKATGGVIGINSAGIEEGMIGFSIPVMDVLDLAEGWSKQPMATLPDTAASGQDDTNASQGQTQGQGQQAASITEYSQYLVKHFYDSLNSADYVYAYSLLGGNWKEGTSYEDFRQGYLSTRNVVIDDMYVTSDSKDSATVTAVISVDERKDGEYKLSKYQVTYVVAYENDQLKLISGKGKAIE
ncbi:S1C family serine protease [Paenibacillus protaetiae]|uniref:Trypsin-like serine protease n=1 Tax=Paenibacillus protaetiae TaxID=2509456 RepID=A0A4P6F200_9BACL|nr:trypsin-like peptidase domain-containing protein [Paenibacillus protaetiae]QAY67097.1 trypsin-like serine protease [Paenibacillus protaetiae]